MNMSLGSMTAGSVPCVLAGARSPIRGREIATHGSETPHQVRPLQAPIAAQASRTFEQEPDYPRADTLPEIRLS
ncbi:hypothetical protein [Pontibacter sp. G13]|uniref:hypothetical protein n=1 Tax=Pontibacter sp. G13 TaxID=3074898 RepID=UPI00288BD276|nr:hypothetical protein [Pontibacter sp. G13]WNJ17715.1 hypothetical protein RJD25_22920 [Pontibacter sp. G13]